MTSIMISTQSQFYQLATELNQSQICNELGITSFEAGDSYLKWFAPSIDYPSILNSYHLYGPIKIAISHQPKLIVCEMQGEKDYLLDQVCNSILGIVTHSNWL